MERILVVDDEEHTCRVLKNGLEAEKHTVTMGVEGMRLAKIQKSEQTCL